VAPVAALPSDVPAAAERRHLTIMFCDLVDSTALSARLDPEDLRAVIDGYHRCVAGVVERAGGFVAKYMGDGVLAYFGYPRADEHDAERAVRAGLALVEAVAGLDSAAGEPLQVRVGIATGLVVVGDLIGTGAAQEQAVVGETPNLAARLQALAAPNTVVIAPSTRRLTGGLFDYEDLGAVEIRGLAAPVTAARVLRESAAESRFEAHHGPDLTPLVGREEELALLQRRWQQAKAGEGCVVLVSGEPGIGKSRLAQAVIERVSHRIPGGARSARRTTRTMRSTPRLRSWNGRPGSGARTPPRNGSTSWRPCWCKRPMILSRPFRCSRHCCRSQPASVIRR
jgi:class 3 adenylate cyclase